jgi:cytochrome c oxidase assembly protein subunit 15
MFGACLVWIATLRVLLSFRERPLAERPRTGPRTQEPLPAQGTTESAAPGAAQPATASGTAVPQAPEAHQAAR